MFDVYCMPESKKIDDLLRELQLRRMHMAIVLNEFVGFYVVVTFKDISEELVCDIMDESDTDEVADITDIIEIGEVLYMVDTQARVNLLNKRFESAFRKIWVATKSSATITLPSSSPRCGDAKFSN